MTAVDDKITASGLTAVEQPRCSRHGAEHLAEYRWRPGQSGNPKGRAKKKSFEELVAAALDEPQPGTDHTKREELAHRFVEKLLEGERYLMELYLEREWPVPKQNDRTPETAFDQLLVYMIEQYEARLRVTPEGEPLRIPDRESALANVGPCYAGRRAAKDWSPA